MDTNYEKMVHELPAFSDETLIKLADACHQLIDARENMRVRLKKREQYLNDIYITLDMIQREGFGFSLVDEHGNSIVIKPDENCTVNVFFLSHNDKC